MEFGLVHDQKEICHCDHIPLNLEGIRILFLPRAFKQLSFFFLLCRHTPVSRTADNFLSVPEEIIP